MNYKHKTPIQIRFNDIDVMGHVSNTIYPNFFDLGRLEYFNSVLKDKINWKKEGLVLASLKTDFIAPIFLQDEIEVRTSVKSIGESSLEMQQQIVNKKDGEVKCVSSAVMVNFCFITKQSKAIAPEVKTVVLQFEAE